MKHRGKEPLTTEFRCFANYPGSPGLIARADSPPRPCLLLSHPPLSICPFCSSPSLPPPAFTPSPSYPVSSSLLGSGRLLGVTTPLPPTPYEPRLVHLFRASLYRAPSRETIISQGPLANSHPVLRTIDQRAGTGATRVPIVGAVAVAAVRFAPAKNENVD